MAMKAAAAMPSISRRPAAYPKHGTNDNGDIADAAIYSNWTPVCPLQRL
ncbi:hypothetical protein GOB19_28835 [Sinorhizobium meliloti]|nr:hypothetical protein [Sinorhizobium meliloti]MDX0376357.1 hypothetical protein [Sinorhizobium meliloti]